jgi:hypothetical protein
MNDEQLFDFTNAVLAIQSAILLGLIDALKPEERKEPYGVCLHNVLSVLETMTLPKPKPSSLN